MTNHELLEKAAKAAGITIELGDDGTIQMRPVWVMPPRVMGGYEEEWNPLREDAQAFRLAVKLRIEIYEGAGEGPEVWAGYYTPHWKDGQRQRFASEPHGADPYAATRRAIVRAAAEIGKTM